MHKTTTTFIDNLHTNFISVGDLIECLWCASPAKGKLPYQKKTKTLLLKEWQWLF